MATSRKTRKWIPTFSMKRIQMTIYFQLKKKFSMNSNIKVRYNNNNSLYTILIRDTSHLTKKKGNFPSKTITLITFRVSDNSKNKLLQTPILLKNKCKIII